MMGEILVGNALQKLKEIPDESVDCVITSPPYYALRDYGEEVVFVWDGKGDCSHEFEGDTVKKVRGDFSKATVANNKKGLDPQLKNFGSFCIHCSAWRGQLGLEPSPELYIKHLADIFDEVYRVLKKEGNCFIVIGDSYASGNGKSDFGKVNHARSALETVFTAKPYMRRYAQEQGLSWVRSKQLLLIPYRLAIEMQMRGWIIRDLIVWAKTISILDKDGEVEENIGNGLPESVKDRLTKSYEVIIHAVKSEKYYFQKPKTSAKTETFERETRGKGEGKYRDLPFYGGGGSMNRPRPNYNGKFRLIDPESVGSMRARLLRGSGVAGSVLSQEEEKLRKAFEVNEYLVQKLRESGFSIKELSQRTGIEEEILRRFLTLSESRVCLPSEEFWHILKPHLSLGEYEEFITEEVRKLLPVLSPFSYARNVIQANTEPFKGSHFAVMPLKLVRFLVRMGCPEGGLVLDPFGGAGTVAFVCEELKRKWVLVEANPEFVRIIENRLKNIQKRLF